MRYRRPMCYTGTGKEVAGIAGGVMSAAPPGGKILPLPNLTIQGFRGIDELSIAQLGRVNLIAGKNGIGKTTLLEAVKVYAERGRPGVLRELLGDREELAETGGGATVTRPAVDWAALFYGRQISKDSCIVIGPEAGELQVVIQPAEPDPEEAMVFDAADESGAADEFNDVAEAMEWFKVKFQGAIYQFPTAESGRYRMLRRGGEADFPAPAPCQALGPGALDNQEMARLWDAVALTAGENLAVKALNSVVSDTVERVALIGDESRGPRSTPSRRAMVKLSGNDRRIPLRSLGEGALRFFGVALALANSRCGFLVIDEVENGLHHTAQPDFWKLVIRAAEQNEVQVFAATHSWDCVRGFAKASLELEAPEVSLVRLERRNGRLRGIRYSQKNLRVAAEQGIEVR